MRKILSVVCAPCFILCNACCYTENSVNSAKKEEFLKEVMRENRSSYRASGDLDSQKAHFLDEIKSEMKKMSSSPNSIVVASVERSEKTSGKDLSSGKARLLNEIKSEMEKVPPSQDSKTELEEKQQKAVAKEKKHAIRRDFRREIEGWYAGAGTVYSITNMRAINLSVGFEGDSRTNRISDVSVSLGAASGISNCSIQDGANGGVFPYRFKASGNVTSDFVRGKSNKVGFSVAGGFGKFVHGDVYAGADVCLDFVKKQTDVLEAFTTRVAYKSQIKQGGVTPTVAARIGVYSDTLDSMIYGRFGFSLIKSDAEITGLGKVKMASVAPVVGAGLQKKFDHFSVRMEGDYRFLTHKEANLSRGTIDADGFGGDVTNVKVTNGVRLKSHGYAMRIMSMLHM
ncbi:MAG: hypothetical protein LBJ96_02105 [Holosporaceae bacterium]|jgi:hypothetical protein|nr:hypothetical protein [Holosporaceae bacterium]